jgi:transcriptional regulator with XRE-family HTH domain
MINQKLFIMKQPELGKKISELRKAKGLTQEELVEKCNLNVRTIQRIEAGEVTPRTFTIKALFEALEYRWESQQLEDSTIAQKVPAYLYVALGAAVVYFFLSIFEIVIETEYLESETSVGTVAFGWIKSGSYIFYVIFLLGWVKLTDFYPNGILKIVLWIMIGANVIWYAVDMFALFTDAFSLEDYYLVKVSSFGFMYASLGLGFVSYKNQFSGIGMILGILLIITGILLITGVGALLALIPWTLGEIMQIALMIYLIQKIGRRNSPGFTT